MKDSIRFLKTMRKQVHKQRFSIDGVNAKGNLTQLINLKQKAHYLNANDAIMKKVNGNRKWRLLPMAVKMELIEKHKQRSLNHERNLQSTNKRKIQGNERQKAWRKKAAQNKGSYAKKEKIAA